VVAYALTLSTTAGELAEGEALYFEACSKCHAEDGTGIGAVPDLTAPGFYADRTLASMLTVIQDGAEDMPGYGDVYDEGQQLALAQYVRSLAASRSRAPSAVATSDQPVDPAVELQTEAVTGSIEGQVVNATTNSSLPSGLEVAIVGFDGDTPVFNSSVPVDSSGRYAIDGLEIVPGRIYGAIVEYEGVPYYSSAGHILAEAPDLELPLSIYETTPDLDDVQVDRLHLIFDFSVEGVVEVSQLWLISNSGDKTVMQPGGENAIPVALPAGATNLQFSDPAASALYTVTDDGFVMHEPIRPDTPLELIFSFSLPYTSRLDYEQRVTLPVSAVVLLAEQNAPEFAGEGLVDTGQQTMGSMALRTYALAGFEVGETLTLSIRGRSASAAGPDSNLVIGIAALALALIVTGLGWRQLRSRDDRESFPEPSEPGGMDREQLLHAIASLDTAYERGELDESAYQARRNTLKTELASLMKSKND
jgi:cytochrome c5